MKKSLMRFLVAAAATSLGLGLSAYASLAFADVLTITENGLPNGYEVVSINTGTYKGTVTGVYAGQQELTVTAVNGIPVTHYHLFAWCVDFGQDIYINSTNNQFTPEQFSTVPLSGFKSVPSVSMTQPMLDELNWLANYGNTILASGKSNQVSAAVQIAMWETEYGFTYAGGGDSGLSAKITDVLDLYANPTSRAAFPLTGMPVLLSSINGTTQELSTFFVPEPGSLALLGLGLAALSFIRRKQT